MRFQIFFCLLLGLNFICESCAMTLEQLIRDTVEKGLKTLSQLKEQLPKDIRDETSNELISPMELEHTTLWDKGPDPVPTSAQQLNLPSREICSCVHRHEMQKEEASAKNPRFLGALSKHVEHARGRPTTTLPTTSTRHPTPTPVGASRGQFLNDAQFDLQELELKLEDATRDACLHYKKIPELDIDRMADVWQLAFYKAEEELTCFKIFIKKTSPQNRKRYKLKYSSFNDTIDWQECYLELCSTGKRLNNMRHFLQGSKGDKGVLENIVLLPTNEDGKNVITLLDQAPDQWMVTKNLLLMRDCESGDVVIFTRIPSKPEKDEIIDAMNTFGENGMNGTTPCKPLNDNRTKEKNFYHIKYNILS